MATKTFNQIILTIFNYLTYFLSKKNKKTTNQTVIAKYFGNNCFFYHRL